MEVQYESPGTAYQGIFFKNAALLYVRLPLHFHDKNRSRVKAIPQKLIHGAYEAIVLAISKVHS